MRGAWLAVGPFTLFYAIPFLFDLTIPGLIPGGCRIWRPFAWYSCH